MKDEKKNYDFDVVTIRVDRTKGVRLDHVCARCGAVAQSTPVSYDSMQYETGKIADVFVVRTATPPRGWDRVRLPHLYSDSTSVVDVCPACLRAFFVPPEVEGST
jgi:hypothetical protein